MYLLFYFTIFLYFRNVWYTLLLLIYVCSEKVNKHHRSFHSFTTEHVPAALIRLELTILVITEIINTLMPNQYKVKQLGKGELFTTLHTWWPSTSRVLQYYKKWTRKSIGLAWWQNNQNFSTIQKGHRFW